MPVGTCDDVGRSGVATSAGIDHASGTVQTSLALVVLPEEVFDGSTLGCLQGLADVAELGDLLKLRRRARGEDFADESRQGIDGEVGFLLDAFDVERFGVLARVGRRVHQQVLALCPGRLHFEQTLCLRLGAFEGFDFLEIFFVLIGFFLLAMRASFLRSEDSVLAVGSFFPGNEDRFGVSLVVESLLHGRVGSVGGQSRDLHAKLEQGGRLHAARLAAEVFLRQSMRISLRT